MGPGREQQMSAEPGTTRAVAVVSYSSELERNEASAERGTYPLQSVQAIDAESIEVRS